MTSTPNQDEKRARLPRVGRYTVLFMVATGAVGMLLHNSRTYSRRIRDSIVFSIIGSYPIALRLIRNYHVSGGGTDRKMVFHPVTLAHIQVALWTISTWILPARIPGITGGLVLLMAVSGLLFLNFTRLRKEGSLNGVGKNERYSGRLSFLLFITMGPFSAVAVVIALFSLAGKENQYKMTEPEHISSK